MNYELKRLYNLKEEKQVLERSLNLYYFDRKKRDMLFSRLEKVTLEIERVEKNANNYTWQPSNQKKSRQYCDDKRSPNNATK